MSIPIACGMAGSGWKRTGGTQARQSPCFYIGVLSQCQCLSLRTGNTYEEASSCFGVPSVHIVAVGKVVEAVANGYT